MHVVASKEDNSLLEIEEMKERSVEKNIRNVRINIGGARKHLGTSSKGFNDNSHRTSQAMFQ